MISFFLNFNNLIVYSIVYYNVNYEGPTQVPDLSVPINCAAEQWKH